jgi:transcriptional regulator with XRE-family HTH domain
MEYNLRRIRRAKDVTIQELSKETGVSVATISEMERGIRENPTVNTIEKLAKALGVKFNDLLKED